MVCDVFHEYFSAKSNLNSKLAEIGVLFFWATVSVSGTGSIVDVYSEAMT